MEHGKMKTNLWSRNSIYHHFHRFISQLIKMFAFFLLLVCCNISFGSFWFLVRFATRIFFGPWAKGQAVANKRKNKCNFRNDIKISMVKLLIIIINVVGRLATYVWIKCQRKKKAEKVSKAQIYQLSIMGTGHCTLYMNGGWHSVRVFRKTFISGDLYHQAVSEVKRKLVSCACNHQCPETIHLRMCVAS